MLVNLNATLAKAEQEALRLQQQAEQEAAMAVALPLRFEQNMAAFRRYIPHIADMYEAYQPARPFKFFCTENGQPNLAWLDDDVAVYGAEPYLICETLQENTSTPAFTVGAGVNTILILSLAWLHVKLFVEFKYRVTDPAAISDTLGK